MWKNLIPQCILTYFEENWVGYKRGNRRKAPRFAIASWNTYGRLRAEKPRTTNELEGWHSGIRKLVGKDHPPFYESVENMWKMEARLNMRVNDYRRFSLISRLKCLGIVNRKNRGNDQILFFLSHRLVVFIIADEYRLSRFVAD